MTIPDLKQKIQAAFAGEITDKNEIQNLVTILMGKLDSGEVRSAEPDGDTWRANAWVKQGILLAFRVGELAEYSINDQFKYFDKHNIPLRNFKLTDNVRIVPGGTTVRAGSFISPKVVMMPPAYVNIGAYVDEGTMVDSHALVGSCAQIGKNVHLSAAAQIGGVLEPVGAVPVVIEDNVIVGGMCGVFEGTILKKNAVLGAGVVLTRSTPVYDCVNEVVLRADKENSLTIPEGAVVVPGSRPMRGKFASENGLMIQAPMIIKYRDANTNAATALEDALR